VIGQRRPLCSPVWPLWRGNPKFFKRSNSWVVHVSRSLDWNRQFTAFSLLPPPRRWRSLDTRRTPSFTSHPVGLFLLFPQRFRSGSFAYFHFRALLLYFVLSTGIRAVIKTRHPCFRISFVRINRPPPAGGKTRVPRSLGTPQFATDRLDVTPEPERSCASVSFSRLSYPIGAFF